MTKYRFDCGCEVDLLDEEIKGYDQLPKLKIDYDQIIEDLNYEPGCPLVWELLNTGKAKGVFQLETHLGQSWAKKVGPSSLEEMSALISLMRPGVLKAMSGDKSMAQLYVDRKHKVSKVEYISEELREFLAATYGVLLYQEQTLAIVKGLAGFSEEEADILRRGLGKKKADVVEQCKKDMIVGFNKIGKLTGDDAQEVADWIEKGNRYLFNKCVSGDTIIRRANTRKEYIGMTVEEMYKIRNDISYAKRVGKLNTYKQWKLWGHYGGGLSLNNDGRIRRNIIKDIRYMGKRVVFRITLEDGSYIDVTNNHKFPTPRGEQRCDQLSIGDYLCKKEKYETSDFKKIGRFSTLPQHQIKSYDGQGFPVGAANPGYTNGSYTLYRKFKENTPNVCEECQSTVNIEVHHRNRDRTDSSATNLIKLCSSCHKKEDYKLGRVKKGEKGYPSSLYKIQSITQIGERDVYDVEMGEPNHTFVTGSDIVTCNSHGISYGGVGYLTAWVKVHFPLHFYCSWIKYARNKQKAQQEVKELVKDARSFNIDVYTPTIDSLWANESDVCIDIDKIVFGIRSVKNMGDANVKDFLKKISDVEKSSGIHISDMTWLEFLLYLAPIIKKTTIISLISVGMFDYFGIARQRMLYEYDITRTLTKGECKKLTEFISKNSDLKTLTFDKILEFFSELGTKEGPSNKNRAATIKELVISLANPPYDVDHDDPKWVMTQEIDLLGVPLSYSAIDTVDCSISANTTCQEFENGKNAENMIIAGEVISARPYNTKNGKVMGFVTLEDNTGEIDAVIFSEGWAEYSHLLFEGSLIHCIGKRSDRGSFLIEKIHEI